MWIIFTGNGFLAWKFLRTTGARFCETLENICGNLDVFIKPVYTETLLMIQNSVIYKKY